MRWHGSRRESEFCFELKLIFIQHALSWQDFGEVVRNQMISAELIFIRRSLELVLPVCILM